MESLMKALLGTAVGAVLGRALNVILAGLCGFVAWAALFGPPLPDSAASDMPGWLMPAIAGAFTLFGVLFLLAALKPGRKAR